MRNEIARLTLGAGERRESNRLSSSVTNGGVSTARSQKKFEASSLELGRLMFIPTDNDIVRCESGPKVATEVSKISGIEGAVGKHQELYLFVDKNILLPSSICTRIMMSTP